jgi:hypothetical protein
VIYDIQPKQAFLRSLRRGRSPDIARPVAAYEPAGDPRYVGMSVIVAIRSVPNDRDLRRVVRPGATRNGGDRCSFPG